MADPTAIAGVSLGCLSLAFTEVRVRIERRRRRAIGPSEEVRGAREFFEGVIAHGGRNVGGFGATERSLEHDLFDASMRVDDDELSTQLDLAGQAWRSVFASAPPGKGLRGFELGQPYPEAYRRQDLQQAAQKERQVEAARGGLEAARSALNRFHKLEKKAH